jgi:hypothetical protein
MAQQRTIVIEVVDNGFIISHGAEPINPAREICVNEAKLLRRLKELLAQKQTGSKLLTED